HYGGGVACGDCIDAAILDDTAIYRNTAGLGGGGLDSGGLGGTTRMGDRSSIHDNSAPVGGGVRLKTMELTVSGTGSIRHNVSTDAGGGAYVVEGASLLLTDHTSIDHNATAGSGGGVAIGSFGSTFGNFGNVSVAGDASVTANTAAQGGGTYVEDQ